MFHLQGPTLANYFAGAGLACSKSRRRFDCSCPAADYVILFDWASFTTTPFRSTTRRRAETPGSSGLAWPASALFGLLSNWIGSPVETSSRRRGAGWRGPLFWLRRADLISRQTGLT